MSKHKQKTNKQFVYTTCSELGIFMYSTGNSMNNILSYFGSVDARIPMCFRKRFTCTNLKFLLMLWEEVRHFRQRQRCFMKKKNAFRTGF